MNALLEGLRRITNIKEETTTPLTKFEPPPVPAHQSNRHHQNSSVIAQGLADINSGARDVYIASRVVGGGFANGLLGRMEKYDFGAIKAVATGGLSVVLNDAPDPTHHWCVVVGDYLHQLQATDLYPGGWNYYTNEVFDMHGGWTKYKLGVTNFNDVAVVNAASKVMNDMPEVYDLFNNNCQHFTLRLLDQILRDGRKKVKMANQTYGQMRLEPMEPLKTTKVYKIGEEPLGEEVSAQKIIEPTPVKAPRLEVEDESVEIADRNGDIAVVADEESHLQMIQDAVSTMIKNTPSIKEAAKESQ